MKRITALFLSFLMLVGSLLLAACGSGPENETEPVSSAVTTESEESTVPPRDGLPEKMDYKGDVITVFYRSEVVDEFYSEGVTGSLVNDAIYKSINAVQERMNIKLNVETMKGHASAERKPYMSFVSNQILTNDCHYDWVDVMVYNASGMVAEGVFQNLYNSEVLEFDRPYYVRDQIEALSINKKMYSLVNDASLGYVKCGFCLYFNKKLAEEINVNLYSTVDEGKWTVDKMISVISDTKSDLNGDGKINLNDRLGYAVLNGNHVLGYILSCGYKSIDKTPEGAISIAGVNDRNETLCEKVYALNCATPGSYYPQIAKEGTTVDDAARAFVGGTVLLCTAEMDYPSSTLADMKNMGVIPFPKLDENSDGYVSGARTTHNSFNMPITVSDARVEEVERFIEALASEKYDTVVPNYFEVIVKSKYSETNDDARMFDLIHNGMALDFGLLFNSVTAAVDPFYYGTRANAKEYIGYTNAMKMYQTSMNSKLDKLIDSLPD